MDLTISEALQQKWSDVLEHPELPKISDPYKKAVTTMLLENQEQFLKEDAPTNFSNGLAGAGTAAGGNVSKWDPILISLVRRAMPNLIAYDICGVQPMSGPTGLIFAMRSRYMNQIGPEALYQEPDTYFGGSGSTGTTANGVYGTGLSGSTTGMVTTGSNGVDPFELNDANLFGPTTVTPGRTTLSGEALGDSATNPFPQMAFSIEKTSVEAKTRALKAEYTMELAQDLKAIHGLDAETELANILSSEILAEINREVVRVLYQNAKLGARQGTVQTRGVFDLNVDSNGRWSVEKFKGLIFQIERECNMIAKETRRGKGNFVLCSADVASALSASGMLDYTPALSTNLNVDDTGSTFAGTINGRLRVYIDPYASMTTTHDFFMVGYKGSSAYDAGIFYCPYVPLQMVRAVGENTFQPKIGFKTRYGLVNNPFATIADNAIVSDPYAAGSKRANVYYRIVKVTNLF